VAGDFIGFRDASSLWLFSAKTVNVEMGKPQQRLRIGGSGVGPTHRQRLSAERSAKGPRTPNGQTRMWVAHNCCGDAGHGCASVQTSRVVTDRWDCDCRSSHDDFVPRVRTCRRSKWEGQPSVQRVAPPSTRRVNIGK